jgi:hypothetical protein
MPPNIGDLYVFVATIWAKWGNGLYGFDKNLRLGLLEVGMGGAVRLSHARLANSVLLCVARQLCCACS